jgi:hypothetical protein
VIVSESLVSEFSDGQLEGLKHAIQAPPILGIQGDLVSLDRALKGAHGLHNVGFTVSEFDPVYGYHRKFGTSGQLTYQI